MSTTIQKFKVIRRPANIQSPFSLVVMDAAGRPRLPLTTFYHKLLQQFSLSAIPKGVPPAPLAGPLLV